MKSQTTIKNKIFWAVYSLILILTLLIDILVFYTYKNDIGGKIESFGNQTINEMALNMSKNILNAEESITYKINSCNLMTSEEDYEAYTENGKEIKAFVALVANSGMDVRSCYIERTDGSEVFWTDGSSTIDSFRDSEAAAFLEKNVMNQNRGTVIWRHFADTPDSVYLIKNVIDYDTLQKQGILCIQINSTFFQTMESNKNLYLMIDDEEGNLLYSSEEISAIVQDLSEKKNHDYYTMSEKLPKKNWTLTGLTNKHQALYNLEHLMIFLLLLEIGFFSISVFITGYVSENMTINIRALISNMKKIEKGQPAEIIDAKSADETAYLVEAFNNMNQRLQDTMNELIANQTQKERAEYNALIAQLNPHFLYNSLESISAMAKLNDQREIVNAIGNLSKLLRICLSEKDAEININKELDYITQYLALEQMITGGQIEWEIECGEDMKGYLVPKLILQPLVENSIVHGFCSMQDSAMIVIVVRSEEEKLILEVSDNGLGMAQQYADEILTSEEVKKFQSDRRHIGIKSIQQRIQYLYGEEYGIEIKTGVNAGTTVKLILPARRGDKDNV